MKKFRIVLVVTLVLMIMLPIFTVSAETIDYTKTYKWLGTGLLFNDPYLTTVERFNMSDGNIAYCADINTYINKTSPYVKVPLELAESTTNGIIPVGTASKIRAILNYAWDKKDHDNVIAVQYALWHFINGTNLPAQANTGIKAIYAKLLSDVETPGIAASAEAIVNTLTLTGPSSASQEIASGTTTYTFKFTAVSSTGAAIVFTVKDGANHELVSGTDYTIVKNADGTYTITFNNITAASSFNLTATTLKNKSVGAGAFVTFKQIEGINVLDKSFSQTVVGIKPSETTQSRSFNVSFVLPQPTTTAAETTTVAETTTTAAETTTVAETTTTAAETTTVAETTTTAAETTAVNETTTAAETTIRITDETIPLVVPTTSTIADATTITDPSATTAATTEIKDDEIPKTGEANQGILIGGILIALAGSLVLLLRRRKLHE
ncbi:MAG: thioester domain-containing protein [Clostridiaceae bacterium]|nr:thioester domain-containing protein [Clostridiaceae bacterium]